MKWKNIYPDGVDTPAYKCNVSEEDRVAFVVDLVICLSHDPFSIEEVSFTTDGVDRPLLGFDFIKMIDKDRTVLELLTKMTALSDMITIKGHLPGRDGETEPYTMTLFLSGGTKNTLLFLDAERTTRSTLRDIMGCIHESTV